MVGLYALAFDRITDLLGRLAAWITTQLNAEGHSVSLATVEYVLACYSSHDAGFPLELALEGILYANEEEASAVRLAVNPAAQVVAQMFTLEEEDDAAPAELAVVAGAALGTIAPEEPAVGEGPTGARAA